MAKNEGFSSEQEEQFRAAVPNQNCRFIFDDDEYYAYFDEQKGLKPVPKVQYKKLVIFLCLFMLIASSIGYGSAIKLTILVSISFALVKILACRRSATL